MDACPKRRRRKGQPQQQRTLSILLLLLLLSAVIVGGFLFPVSGRLPSSRSSNRNRRGGVVEPPRPSLPLAPWSPSFASASSSSSPSSSSSLSSSSSPSSSSHLSILELLKATIGLHSGPWNLLISNTSVIRLSTAREVWNETEPWRRYPVGFKRPTSSAFVADLSKRYIITADHVLASHFRITASRPGLEDGQEFRARVLCRAPDWDLALLTVEDAGFWEGIEAAPLNGHVTCRPESFVTVAGYLNKSLTTDEWMVRGYSPGPSCLNLDLYRGGQNGWGGKEGPVMPFGCSGGPVLAQTKGLGWSIVGMLSAGQPDRAVLHTVPAHLIQRMIQQYETHGKFLGGSSPAFRYQKVTNAYLRERLEMGSAASGVLITEVAAWGGEAGLLPLKQGDVLMEIDGLAVDDQGTISLPPDRLQVDLRGLWDLKEDGESVTAKVLREGRVVNLQGTTKHISPLVPISSATMAPPRAYVLVGGLLFLPASQAKVAAHQERINQAPIETQILLKAEARQHLEEEFVLLWRIYPHEVNEGYEERLARLLKFNGEAVRNLAHLEEMVRKARPEEEEAEWLEFEFADTEQQKVVLPAFQAWASEAIIRKTNRIPQQRPRTDDGEGGKEGGKEGEEDDEEDDEDDDEVIAL